MNLGQKKRVLVVEDEPSIVDNIVFGLNQEGFEVETCGTGADALEALRGNGFSLVVLDVGLPDTTGFEVCKEIRRLSEIPIIFLTARNEEIDRILGLEIGGDDYMVKPFSVRELATRVKVILRRVKPSFVQDRPTNDAKMYKDSKYGSFSLDEERYQMSYCGVALSLTRYEFRLLRLLVKSTGRVLSREQLMYQVWEEPEASGERTVDAHVKSLRSKLRKIEGSKDPIKTHRGIGYSIEP